MKKQICILLVSVSLAMVTNFSHSSCKKHVHKKPQVHKHYIIQGVPCCYVQEKKLYQLWPYSWGPTNECISERKREIHKPNCGI
jgi:hypothetical protein